MDTFTSYLRVYEPLAAFPPRERRRWERYVADGQAPDRVRGRLAEHQAAIVAAIAGSSPIEVDHAFVHRNDGQPYVCPWRTEMRVWAAMAEFRRSMPDEVADAFIPRTVAETAERELERWRAEQPDLKAHILSEPWQVPLRWFLLFESEERRLVLDAERSLSYLTSMANARRRLARSLAVLRRTIEEGPVTAGVVELGRWLEEFHPRSLVELDYGGLAALFDDDELYGDESAADVQHAVACLDAGEVDEAAAAYARASARWDAVRALEVAN